MSHAQPTTDDACCIDLEIADVSSACCSGAPACC